jgi:hypothetical protein
MDEATLAVLLTLTGNADVVSHIDMYAHEIRRFDDTQHWLDALNRRLPVRFYAYRTRDTARRRGKVRVASVKMKIPKITPHHLMTWFCQSFQAFYHRASESILDGVKVDAIKMNFVKLQVEQYCRFYGFNAFENSRSGAREIVMVVHFFRIQLAMRGQRGFPITAPCITLLGPDFEGDTTDEASSVSDESNPSIHEDELPTFIGMLAERLI